MESRNVLNRVVNVCDKDVGERQEHLIQLYERWKARVIVDDKSYLLSKCCELLPSGRQFRVPKSNLHSVSFLNR